MSETLLLRGLERLSETPFKPLCWVTRLIIDPLWRWKPGLANRLSTFLLIGGVGTVIQFNLLFLLHGLGVDLIMATLIGIQAAALWSFTANRFITWRDRFTNLTSRQSIIWFLPLFLVSDITTVTIWVKVVGIKATVDYFGLPLGLVWVVYELTGTVANYLGADKISFGLMARLVSRIGSANPGLQG